VVVKRNTARIGNVYDVLIEQAPARGSKRWIGRASFQAPDVDSHVLVAGKAVVGQFVRVNITGTSGIDLCGEIL
jgi:tRNA A37 methylthiotransferase MiaB